jgi:serine/threonine protein kinase
MANDTTAGARLAADQAGVRRRQQMAGFTALPLGTRLDHFVIDTVIGAGGFGITYLVQHDTLKKPYALKEYFPREFAYREGLTVRSTQTASKTFTWGLTRFLDEARALAKFKHPAIVDVAHVFEANGTAYMALAYEQGRTFGTWLRDLGRPPTQAELDQLTQPLLDALETMHGAGMLHRDIAPDNILVRDNGTPVLLDFGAARSDLQERTGPVTAIVKTGYSPQEQYKTDAGQQGPWSDIYAFSANLYQAVSGRPPMDAMDRVSSTGSLQSATNATGQYRAGFIEAIDWGMRMAPLDRPQSIAAWREQLLATDAPTVAMPQSSHQCAPEPVPRRGVTPDTSAPRAWAMPAIAGIAAAGLVVTGLLLTSIMQRPVAGSAGKDSQAPSSTATGPTQASTAPAAKGASQPAIEVAIDLPKSTFAIGDAFTFVLRANRDCNLLVFTIDSDDKVELHDPAASGAFMGAPILKAGETRQIPVPGAPGRAVIKAPVGSYQLGAVCAREDLAKLGLAEAQLRTPAASGKRNFSFKLDEAVRRVQREDVSRVTVPYEVK